MEVSNVKLAIGGLMKTSSYNKEDFYAREFKNARKIKPKVDRNQSKKIRTISISLALTVVLTGGVAAVSNVIKPVNKVVSTIEVPLEMTANKKYYIEIYENGDALFMNNSGEKFAYLNGINARTVANQLGVPTSQVQGINR